jgi:hypothetical protein
MTMGLMEEDMVTVWVVFVGGVCCELVVGWTVVEQSLYVVGEVDMA